MSAGSLACILANRRACREGMMLRRIAFCGVWMVVMGGLLASAVRAQELHTIRLRNGSVLRGRVVRFENGEFTVILSGTRSRAILHVADVESIDFGGEGTSPMASETRTPERGTEVRPQEQPASQPVTTPAPAREAAALPQYTEYTVRVPAATVWTDTGIDLVKGQKVRLAATGRIFISRTQEVGPEGIELRDPNKLMPDRPSGGLIAVIGEDNDDFIFIGPAAELVAHRSGRFFLMVNDSTLEDNRGEFTVRIQVSEPPRPEAKPR